MKPNTHTRTISSSKCIQESHQVVCVAKLLNQFHSPVYALIQFMIQLILDSLIKFPSQTNSVRLWSKSFSIATSTKVKRWNVVQGEGNLPQKSTFCLKKYPPKKKLDGFIDCTSVFLHPSLTCCYNITLCLVCDTTKKKIPKVIPLLLSFISFHNKSTFPSLFSFLL